MIRTIACVGVVLTAANAQTELADRAQAARAEHDARLADAESSLFAPWRKQRDDARAAADLDAITRLDDDRQFWEITGQIPGYLHKHTYQAAAAESLRTLLAELGAIKAAATKAGEAEDLQLARSLAAEIQAMSLQQQQQQAQKPFEPRPKLGTELLRNGGCEAPANKHRIHGWTTIEGAWGVRTEDGGKFPGPHDGNAYFTPTSGGRCELCQEVDVSGFARGIDAERLQVQFRGHVSHYDQSPGDRAWVVLEFLDANGKVLSTAYQSSPRGADKHWQPVGGEFPLDVGTRRVRVRLLSDMAPRHGKAKNNDGYHDALSLKLAMR